MTLEIKSKDVAKTLKFLYQQCPRYDIYPEKVEVEEPSLESLFMEVVQ